jgi:hypothetical protein
LAIISRALVVLELPIWRSWLCVLWWPTFFFPLSLAILSRTLVVLELPIWRSWLCVLWWPTFFLSLWLFSHAL